MFGKKHREEEIAAEAKHEQQEAVEATETDGSFVDPDEPLKTEEELEGTEG